MAKQMVMAKPFTKTGSRLAFALIMAGALFVFLLSSLHMLQPEFDPTWRFISEYALGGYGWMMHLMPS